MFSLKNKRQRGDIIAISKYLSSYYGRMHDSGNAMAPFLSHISATLADWESYAHYKTVCHGVIRKHKRERRWNLFRKLKTAEKTGWQSSNKNGVALAIKSVNTGVSLKLAKFF